MDDRPGALPEGAAPRGPVPLLSALSGAQPANDGVCNLPGRRFFAVLATRVRDLCHDATGIGEGLMRGARRPDMLGDELEPEFCVHGSGIGLKSSPLYPISPEDGVNSLMGKG